MRIDAFFGKESLPFGWVTGVFRDGNDVWVGTKNGTRIFDLAARKWRNPPAGFSGNAVTGLARFGGKLFAATDTGLNVGGRGGWETMNRIANAVTTNGDLAVSEGALWLAARTMTGGLLQFDGTAWKLLSRGEGTGVMSNITRLSFRNGELWAATTNNGIFVLKSGEWTVMGPEDGLPGLWITSLAGTGDGMYAGSPDGLGFFDGRRWKVYRVPDGLPSNKVSALKVYKNKVIIGTFDRGISIFDGRRFRNVGSAEGLSDDRVQAIEVVEDTVWVGTINGLSLIHNP
jgi:ligand-binding sensor domain-containing protein